MNDAVLLGLLIAGAVAVAVTVRMTSGYQAHELSRLDAKLSRLDAKVEALLKHAGIRFDPYGDVPPAVLDALRSGKKIEAIKEYRAATGAGLQEAKDFVEEIQRRAATRG